MSLPNLFIHGAQNEDATVELLALEELASKAEEPLRVLSIASCGTHVAAMSCSSAVGHIDAVDIAPGQLKVAALINAAIEALSSPEELALFIGNSGEDSERRDLYWLVRPLLDADVADFWDTNVATVETGVLQSGGTERLFARMREQLPSQDIAELATQPDAVLAAFEAAFTVSAMEEQMPGLPRAVAEQIVEQLISIAAQFSARISECVDSDPDLMLELIVRGSYPMAPISSRPQFLRPDVFAAIKQHVNRHGRIQWHEGPIQDVGQSLARENGRYDLIDMSNMLSLDAPDDAKSIIEALDQSLRPDGFMLCRGEGPPGALAQIFSECGMQVDEQMSARALGAESSFLHKEVCIVRPTRDALRQVLKR